MYHLLKYQLLLKTTGNNDLCYYNFRCLIPIDKVLSFNNIISNIGYMVFGITFLIIVWYKQYLYNKMRRQYLESNEGNNFKCFFLILKCLKTFCQNAECQITRCLLTV